jgi:Protein of unknown function (DUF3575)
MKITRILTILLFYLFYSLSPATAQDLGYKTVDVGGEFQHYGKGFIAVVHLAYNARIHHSVQLRIGYNKSDWKDEGEHDNEEGGGPGLSIGYRYYFPVRPHGFFLGVRTDYYRLSIDWRQANVSGKSKINVFQPSFEMGYMLLINDMFFITPTIGAGVQANVTTNGESCGDGFLFLPGVSAGWKF